MVTVVALCPLLYKSGRRPVSSVKKKAWNSDRPVGQKQGYTPKEVTLIRSYLEDTKQLRNLALFNFGICTAFRSSDTTRLKICDITYSNGTFREHLHIYPKKTRNRKKALKYWISPRVHQSLKDWLDHNYGENCPQNAFLFPGKPDPNTGIITKPLSRKQHSVLVKQWTAAIGLNPEDYSTHSIRRSKTQYVYDKTGDKRACKYLLGHRSEISTEVYLNDYTHIALEYSKLYDI